MVRLSMTIDTDPNTSTKGVMRLITKPSAFEELRDADKTPPGAYHILNYGSHPFGYTNDGVGFHWYTSAAEMFAQHG